MFELGDIVRPNKVWYAWFGDKMFSANRRDCIASSIFEVVHCRRNDEYDVHCHASAYNAFENALLNWSGKFLEKL